MIRHIWLQLVPPLILLLCTSPSASTLEQCDKSPSGTKIQKTEADGRFKISVVETVRDEYLPGNNYTVRLRADDNSYFTYFLIMAHGQYVLDKGNARKHNTLDAGTLHPKIGGKMHTTCVNAVQQTDNAPKSIVEVEWIAPVKGNGCVTIHAMVAESPEVWYMDDDIYLKIRVCEDVRKIIDIEPLPLEGKCQVCGEAKYELTFEGQWLRNTHPREFPEAANRRFSDLVGASHAADYHLWDYDSPASAGLKLLAESANTTILEREIQSKFHSGVRTLIKATGHEGVHLSEPTSAIFRVDKKEHLISIAISIVPSPDWFLGVSHFELCYKNNTWVPDRELNLYLIDAGTDNGVSYESSNEETLPPGFISRIVEHRGNRKSPFFSENPGTPRHFAKMRVQLLRVYNENSCDEDSESDSIVSSAEEA